MNRVCANPTCEVSFSPKTVTMIYHSAECRSEATNTKAKQNYYENKAREAGLLQRTCVKCNVTQLSRYNKEKICEPCMAQPKEDARHILLRQLGVA